METYTLTRTYKKKKWTILTSSNEFEVLMALNRQLNFGNLKNVKFEIRLNKNKA